MAAGAIDADVIVGLIGVLMAMALVSRSTRLRALSGRQRLMLGASWAAIFGVVAALAGLLSRGSP